MGCHGAINGTRVAKGYVDADPGANVLLVAVQLCSLHFQNGWDAERNALASGRSTPADQPY